jgi:Asp-tRNA(Asn)/Glu-tRNA(Gln) amidotransferase A subunit family amidase
VVRRLRAAGAVIIAKTGMSEFAFSGVGMNPHYGTPGNPADRARVPGGSSSGAAVAAADHMCEIAIGTDTGGSTRIPGALCGYRRLQAERMARADRGRVFRCRTRSTRSADCTHGGRLREGRRHHGR